MPTRRSTICRFCEQCGKPFFPEQSQIDRGKGTCCSLSCAASKPRRPLLERFLKKVRKTKSCWVWIGTLSIYGYGMIWTGKRQTPAHRAAWELFKGPIPNNLCVLHNCPGGDNTDCVNPAHLFLGTKADNNTDRAKKGRNADQRGEKNTNAILIADQVISIRRRNSEGVTQRRLAIEHGVCFQAINDIVRRKSWKHI